MAQINDKKLMTNEPKRRGRPPGTGKGRTVLTRSINLPPEAWTKLDAIKGTKSRSEWIARKIAEEK